MTPWGTIISAEENPQDYYGDYEPFWGDPAPFTAAPGGTADINPAGNIVFDPTPSATSDFGKNPTTTASHPRDQYSWLTEVDPGVAPNSVYDPATGAGHRKLGALGRGRWENVTFWLDENWELINNKPIVMYAAADRRGGRIYKYVTTANWTSGMSRASTRNLLDSVRVYVAHFADLDNAGSGLVLKASKGGLVPTPNVPGTGQWILLSVTNTTQDAPNAAAPGIFTGTGTAPTKVGAVLQASNYNSMGGFPDDNAVLKAMFTAEMKLGIMELNRPEDLEWNPFDKSLWIAFTQHGARNALDNDGKLAPSPGGTTRNDPNGAIFRPEGSERRRPGHLAVVRVLRSLARRPGHGRLHGVAPRQPRHRSRKAACGSERTETSRGTHGPTPSTTSIKRARAPSESLRVPSDAEATGPAFTPDGKTFFINVQHPGEGQRTGDGSRRQPLQHLAVDVPVRAALEHGRRQRGAAVNREAALANAQRSAPCWSPR